MKKFPIEELIPQRAPFVMVDRLIHFEKGKFTSELKIREDNFFIENERFQEAGLLENIAQTAAAGAGYSFKIEDEPIKLGYIGAMKNAVINQLPKVGMTITTEIKVINQVLNVDIVEGKVFDENHNLIASCEMKIFLD